MATCYLDRKRGTWTVAYDGRLDGKPARSRSFIYGLKTRKLAERAKFKKDEEEQLLRARLIRPEQNLQRIREAEGQSVADLADAFRLSILAKGRKPKYARQQAEDVVRLLKLAAVRTIPEIDAGEIQAAARRLIDEEKVAPRTANRTIKAVRQFSTWLFVTKRTRSDLLHRRLATFKEQVDVRRWRRALDEEEIRWLLATTAAAKDFVSRRCGIAPADRSVLYEVALQTGFRQAALLTLTKASFHVGENVERPFIHLGAAANKKGTDRDQRIRDDLAAKLRDWLKGRPDTGPVWPLSPHADLSLRFRRDMEHARAAWIDAAASVEARAKREGSNFLRYCYHDGVRNVFADFHGLRHTGITRVVRRAGLRVGQWWADHSTPVLTAKYAHLDLADEDGALDALPAVATEMSAAPVRLARRLARRPENAGKRRTNVDSRRAG